MTKNMLLGEIQVSCVSSVMIHLTFSSMTILHCSTLDIPLDFSCLLSVYYKLHLTSDFQRLVTNLELLWNQHHRKNPLALVLNFTLYVA